MTKTQRLLAIGGMVAMALGTAGGAWAQQGQGGSGASRPPGPPQEALDACKGKTAGARVQMTTPYGHTVWAVCKLIAVPEGDPGQGNGQRRGGSPY